jgi:hypothetical protein
MMEYFKTETVLDVMFGHVLFGITDMDETARLLSFLRLDETARLSEKMERAAVVLQMVLPELYDTQAVEKMGYGTVRAVLQHMRETTAVTLPELNKTDKE